VRGFSWQPKSTPVIADGVIYVNSVEGGGGLREDQVPTFVQKLAEMDADGDGRIDEPEMKAVDPKQRFEVLDLDGDLFLGPRDWEFYRARMTSRNNLIALKAGGRGDLTGSAQVLWRLEKFLPNVPSPLVYDGVMYLVKDGGILTALDALTGDVLKQGRLRGALSKYYASPVAADGKIYAVSEDGKASVIRAGKDWEILAVNDLADDVYATPAIVGDRIYLRTRHTLYCFAR
jgi:outer membrane protein assembly factor BamB